MVVENFTLKDLCETIKSVEQHLHTTALWQTHGVRVKIFAAGPHVRKLMGDSRICSRNVNLFVMFYSDDKNVVLNFVNNLKVKFYDVCKITNYTEPNTIVNNVSWSSICTASNAHFNRVRCIFSNIIKCEGIDDSCMNDVAKTLCLQMEFPNFSGSAVWLNSKNEMVGCNVVREKKTPQCFANFFDVFTNLDKINEYCNKYGIEKFTKNNPLKNYEALMSTAGGFECKNMDWVENFSARVDVSHQPEYGRIVLNAHCGKKILSYVVGFRGCKHVPYYFYSDSDKPNREVIKEWMLSKKINFEKICMVNKFDDTK